MNGPIDASKHYLFASDFDQTQSFNDSGMVLSGFHEPDPPRVAPGEHRLTILAA